MLKVALQAIDSAPMEKGGKLSHSKLLPSLRSRSPIQGLDLQGDWLLTDLTRLFIPEIWQEFPVSSPAGII